MKKPFMVLLGVVFVVLCLFQPALRSFNIGGGLDSHEWITYLAMNKLRGIPANGLAEMMDHCNDPDGAVCRVDKWEGWHHYYLNCTYPWFTLADLWNAARTVRFNARQDAVDYANGGNSADAYRMIGNNFHTVQDFYTHTNWVYGHEDDVIADLETATYPTGWNTDGPSDGWGAFWKRTFNDAILATIQEWYLYEDKLIETDGPTGAMAVLVNQLGITPRLTLSSPPTAEAGHVWDFVAPGYIGNTALNIKWFHVAVDHDLSVRISLLRDNALYDEVVISGPAVANGEYSWNVGQCLGGMAPYDNDVAHYRIRITVTTPSGDVTDLSEPFYILDPLYGQPYYLIAKSTNWNCITLTWNDGASGETGYQIYRRRDDETTFSFLKNVAAGATSTTDTSIVADMTYHYRIRAIFSGGDYATGPNESQAIMPNSIPAHPYLTNWYYKQGAYVRIYWVATNDPINEQGAIVERQLASESEFSQIGTLAPNTTMFYDYDLPEEGGTIYYKVTFYNPVGSDYTMIEVNLPEW